MSERGSAAFRAAEERLDREIGMLLQLGVLIAAVVASVGGLVYFVRHGGEPAFYDVFRGEPQDLRSVWGVVRDAAALRGRAVIQLGLLLLVATPVARVALTLVAFARLGDRRYAFITGLVLAALLFSLLGGPS
jgi:uncharacterized membrane protein